MENNDNSLEMYQKYIKTACVVGHRVGDSYLCSSCVHIGSNFTCEHCCHYGRPVHVGRKCDYRRHVPQQVKVQVFHL